MHFLILLAMRSAIGIVIGLIWCHTYVRAQKDSVHFRHYNDFITVYALTGYNATNVSLNPRFGDIDRQRYFFNPPLLFGLGAAYKGLDVGFTRRLPVHLLNSSRFGRSDYFDFKFKFSLKGLHLALRAQKYSGFALLNHKYQEDDLPKPHLFMKDMSTFSVNMDARYFFKKDFSYKAALGFSGEYLRDFFTPYIYAYSGGSNIKNRKKPLLPNYAQDLSASISKSSRFGCFEFGAIPGVAYVKRHRNVQAMILLGWGPLIQTKLHGNSENARVFFGLNSRTDLQWSLGYHKDLWFVQLMSEFQFRRINFMQMNVQQYYYDLRLIFGYLIQVKKHPKVVLDLEEKGLL
jgi:hypothetical protein